MSWLSSLGKKALHVVEAPAKGLLHAVTDPGKWASNIGHEATDPKTLLSLAAGLALPGVGSALTGALGAIPGIGGALASGAGAIGGAAGSAAGAVNGALKAVPGVTSLESLLGGGGSVGGAIPDAAMGSSGGGGLGGLLSSAGSYLTGNGGKNALGIAQGISGILDQKKSENYAKDALGAATGAYNAAAPLRAQGLAGLTNPGSLPDTSNLSQIAGSLKPQTITPGTPQDTGSLDAVRAQLAQLKAPSPVGVSQFTAPQRATRAPMPSDPGNPYARAS